jgi:hypothetical protein
VAAGALVAVLDPLGAVPEETGNGTDGVGRVG